MNGYIKSYRKVEDNPIVCKDNDYFRVWYFLLHNATHKSYEVIFNNEKIILKEGQLLTGRKKVANKCNISESKAERILKTFEIEQQIKQQKTNKCRLISIVNWELYQNIEQQIEQQVNNEWTTTEQQVNTKQEYKECKEYKEIYSSSCYSKAEELFGRTLNPAEVKMICEWLKKYDERIINEAIRLTIVNGKKYLNYTNGILHNWEDKGYKTLTDIIKEDNRKKEFKDYFEYDWLNEDD